MSAPHVSHLLSPSQKNPKGVFLFLFTYPVDLATLPLIAGLSSVFSPPKLSRGTVITYLVSAPAPHHDSKGKLWLLRKKNTHRRRRRRRLIRACPRYSICGDLVFPDRSKIKPVDKLYWEWRNVDQILLLAHPGLYALSGDYGRTTQPFDLWF